MSAVGGGGGGGSIAVKDEGTVLTVAATSIDFAGTGVTATVVGSAVTVTIPASTLATLGISNVENKSSSTIRSELTSLNVTTALGFTPLANSYAPTWASITGKPTFATVSTSGSYNDLSDKPAAYSLPTASNIVLGGVKVDGASISIAAGVISTSAAAIGLGAVENKSSAIIRSEITPANVTAALGFTPLANTYTPTWASLTGTVPIFNQNTTGTAANVTGVVAGANGGTGVANTGKTITLGGNLTTAGAFASTFTMTGATTVTFPTSGTLLSTAAAVTVAQGGTGLSTITSGNVLVGAGTSSPTLVAPSTSGNVLTSNGTTWISSAPAGGSDLVLLAGSTFSGAATVDFTSVFTSTYDGYLIVCRDIMPTTQMELWMRFITDSSTIVNTNYTWSYLAKSFSGNAYSSSTSTSTGTSVRMTNSGSVTTPSDHSISLNIDLGKMTGTRKKNCFWKGVYSLASDLLELGGTGSHGTTSDVTGVRFLINGGTISGSIQIYGYKKAP